MNQHQAPVGTVATLGHPANLILIVKGNDCWRYVDSGRSVDTEDFRAGWDFYDPARIEIIPGMFYIDDHGGFYYGYEVSSGVGVSDIHGSLFGIVTPLPAGLRPAKVVPA